MGDAARHLAERAQPLLLHHRLLRLAQIVVSPLQGFVELRLVGGECDMLAQLPKKLALAAAEAPRLEARRDEDTEDPAFGLQWCHHQRPEPALRQPSRKR